MVDLDSRKALLIVCPLDMHLLIDVGIQKNIPSDASAGVAFLEHALGFTSLADLGRYIYIECSMKATISPHRGILDSMIDGCTNVTSCPSQGK
jgi:hypothetical protein